MALPSNQNNESIISKLDYLRLAQGGVGSVSVMIRNFKVSSAFAFFTPYYSEDEETDIR